MQGLIADADFLGHLRRLLEIFHSQEWLPYWNELNLDVADFQSLGIPPHSSDRTVWNLIQEKQLVLVTNNRNQDGPDSLEAVIRAAPPNSLPVFTVGNAQRLLDEGAYARLVAVDLLDYLSTLREFPERLLGAGRLFLPTEPPRVRGISAMINASREDSPWTTP